MGFKIVTIVDVRSKFEQRKFEIESRTGQGMSL